MPDRDHDQQSSLSLGTRRTKRKADDASRTPRRSKQKRAKSCSSSEQPSPPSARRSPRSSRAQKSSDHNVPHQASKTPLSRKSLKKKSIGNTSKQSLNDSVSRRPASRSDKSKQMTEKDKKDLASLLEKEKSSGDVYFVEIQTQLQDNLANEPAPLPDDGNNAASEKTGSRTRACKHARKAASGRGERLSTESENLDDAEDATHGYPGTQDPTDSDDEDDGSEDDNEIIDVPDDDDDTNGVAPCLGASDDERDVSYNLDDDGKQDARPPSEPDAGRAANINNTQHSRQSEPNDNECVVTEKNTAGVIGEGRAEQDHVYMDESAVLNIVQSLKSDIFSQFDATFGQVLKELRVDREQIKKLRENLSEMTSIVATTASAVFLKQTSSKPRTKEIQSKLCLLNGLFNDHFLLKVLPRVVVGFLVTNTTDVSGYITLQNNGIDYFSMLFFSKQPSEKKDEKFSSEVGKVYSKFRYSLSLSSSLAMQKNSFNTFRNDSIGLSAIDPAQPTEEETSTLTSSATAMLQPFWLKPGYITDSHCLHAANKLEKRGLPDAADEATQYGDLPQANGDTESVDVQDSSQSSWKPKMSRSGPLTREEIGNEAAAMLYRRITSVLHRSRAATKVQLFHDLTYMFTSWSQYRTTADQNSLRISWETEQTPHYDYTADLPRTKINRAHDRLSSLGQDINETDLHNIEQLEKLVSSHPELSLKVEHDVMVNGSLCSDKYRINLIEVACRALSSYTTLQSAAKAKDVLCVDRRSLKAVIFLSIGLRRMMDRAVADHNRTKSIPWRNNSKAAGKKGKPKRTSVRRANAADDPGTQYNFEDINGLSLDHFLPPPSKQKELLNQMLLTLTAEEYDAKMLTAGIVSTLTNDDTSGAASDLQHSEIKANENEGVFGF